MKLTPACEKAERKHVDEIDPHHDLPKFF